MDNCWHQLLIAGVEQPFQVKAATTVAKWSQEVVALKTVEARRAQSASYVAYNQYVQLYQLPSHRHLKANQLSNLICHKLHVHICSEYKINAKYILQ